MVPLAERVELAEGVVPAEDEVLALYGACGWSAASRPAQLMQALHGSSRLVTARLEGRLVGLGNAISDGALVVYFPHLLVHPDVQGKGIGRRILQSLQAPYAAFHQQVLLAVEDAKSFYEAAGFRPAGAMVPMWIFPGEEEERNASTQPGARADP